MWDMIQNTDPLAMTALGGLVTVFIVTIGLFVFIIMKFGSRSGKTR